MINLDQVRTLEWKVKQAVQLIVHLRRENDTLRNRLSDTEVRLQELESLLESFKATQNEMESGIRSALEDLDNLDVEAPVSASEPSGPVDPLSFPPTPEPQASGFAAEDPAALFDKAPEPAPAHEPTFEEEYAALEAAEAASEGDVAPGEGEAAAVPESVELEDSPDAYVSEEESAFLDAPAEEEPEVKEPEERQPEQPGLGIF